MELNRSGSRTVTIEVDEETHKLLLAYAERLGKSVAAVLKDAVVDIAEAEQQGPYSRRHIYK